MESTHADAGVPSHGDGRLLLSGAEDPGPACLRAFDALRGHLAALMAYRAALEVTDNPTPQERQEYAQALYQVTLRMGYVQNALASLEPLTASNRPQEATPPRVENSPPSDLEAKLARIAAGFTTPENMTPPGTPWAGARNFGR